jgi:phosphoesterase RecJ-like protein
MLTIDQQIFEQIKKANRIMIALPDTRDIDAVASALALSMLLKKMDKPADIITNTADSTFSFLPGAEQIKPALEKNAQFVVSVGLGDAKIDNIKYRIEDKDLKFIITSSQGKLKAENVTCGVESTKYDLIFTLNASDLESLGKIYQADPELFYKTPLVNIDHSPENEDYGQINMVDLTAVSTTEIIFDLIIKLDRNFIDEQIATCLLAGIIFATKSYKTENITPNSLLVSSELISMGAKREEVVNHLYRSRPFNVLKLWGRVLARLSGDLDEKLVWASLNTFDFQKTGSSEKDLDDIIDELIINIPKARVIIIIYEPLEKENKSQKASTQATIYSVKTLSALDLAKQWQPTGNKKQALIKIDKPIAEAEKEIIQSIKAKLSKLPL